MKVKALLPLFLLILVADVSMAQTGAIPNSVRFHSPRRAGEKTNASANSFDFHAFGAVGDGVADDGPALQRALDAIADAGGGTLSIPAGRYAIDTPVLKNFAGLAASLTIQGVESLTPVAPPGSGGPELTRGLDLVSEFVPRTGEFQNAIVIAGLEHFLIKDITFIGTPGVFDDALVTLALEDISDANIRHCEFYGLSSFAAGGAIVQAVRTRLTFEQSVVLGSTCASSNYSSVIQNLEWKGITISQAIFADYGQRPELYGKMNSSPYSWVGIGNAATTDNNSPRREVVFRSVFLDEGGYTGISSLPDRYPLPSAPIDLVYITDLFMNVSNFGTTGNYLYKLDNVLVENSHYGWSHNAGSAIYLLSVGKAILDRVECVDSADRILADAAVGNLKVINSVYTHLDSQAQSTNVIATAPEDDPVQYVRQQFVSSLNRDPDAAAHFYWANRILECADDSQCAAATRAALASYLDDSPSPTFAINGQVTDKDGGNLAGAVITLNGAQSATTTSDSAGHFHFSNLPTSGHYTVSAAKNNYIFAAPIQSLITPASDQTVNFAAINGHSITGHIADENGIALSDVTVDLSGSQDGSTTTNESGDFAFPNLPAGGEYEVTPSQAGYSWEPQSRTFDDLSSDEIANFTGTLAVIEFSSASLSVSEGAGTATLTVVRTGNLAGESVVTYSGSDGSGRQGQDLSAIIGKLYFAPGETNKTFSVFITDDAFVENAEQLMVTLTQPDGATLGNRASTMLTIIDNDTAASGNPLGEAHFFVRQHYRDFLNREPDAAGLAFWSNQIMACSTNAECIEDRQINVSAAFFLSIEFQETGFLVHRFYRAAFAQSPQYLHEFLLDSRTISQGVVVNAPGWQQVLADNKTAFAHEFVERPEFTIRYSLELTPEEFGNSLNSSAGSPLTANALEAAIADFNGSPTSSDTTARASVLRRIAESEIFSQRETAPAFVLMQYFGYLQRNPSDPPDQNLDGYNFWLSKLNEFGGDFHSAQMVKSFLLAGEYRHRFGS